MEQEQPEAPDHAENGNRVDVRGGVEDVDAVRTEARDGDRDRLGRFGVGNEWAIKPGEVRNPKGAPPSLVNAIKRALQKNPRRLERLAENLLKQAEAGNKDAIAALRVVLDRLDGAVVQRHEVGAILSPAEALIGGTDPDAIGRASRTLVEGGPDDGPEVPADTA